MLEIRVEPDEVDFDLGSGSVTRVFMVLGQRVSTANAVVVQRVGHLVGHYSVLLFTINHRLTAGLIDGSNLRPPTAERQGKTVDIR